MESAKYFHYFKDNFLRNKIGYVTLFVTSACNARCKHCFYWKNLNQKDDLSFEEIKNIFLNIGKFSVLLLSGGEPLLRTDLFDICSFIIRNNQVKQIIIPTNGIGTKQIISKTKQLCNRFPKVLFSVNPSVDGLKYTHNQIRGLKCFDEVIGTIDALTKVDEKNLQVTVNTVLTNKNFKDIPALYKLINQYNITNHNLELIRGDSQSKNIGLPEIYEIENIHNKVMQLKSDQIKNTSLLNRVIVLGSLYYQFKLKERILQGGKFPFTCEAGKSIVVIYSNGEFSLCELLPSLGNLRDYNYDINKILMLPKTKRSLKKINSEKCSCTHICFLNTSLAKDWRSIYKIPFYWWKWRRSRSN